MTKVTLHYKLSRPLNEDDCAQIAALHSVFGIARVQPNAAWIGSRWITTPRA